MQLIKAAFLVTTLMFLTACGGAGGDFGAEDNGATNGTDTDSDSDGSSGNENDDLPQNPEPPGDNGGASLDPIQGPVGDDELGLVGIAPGSDTELRSLLSAVIIDFNKPLIVATVSREAFKIIRLGDASEVDVDLEYQDGETRVQLIPDTLLLPDSDYEVQISDTVMASTGEGFEGVSWRFTTVPNLGTTPQDVIDNCMSPEDIAMLAAVNNERIVTQTCSGTGVRQNATHTLSYNCLIARAALAHSNDMATENFFSHTGSDGSSSSNRVTNAGYRWRFVGENIAAGYPSVQAAVDGLMASEKGHCENLMNPNFTEFGHSVVRNQNSDFGVYWTQNFAAPL